MRFILLHLSCVACWTTAQAQGRELVPLPVVHLAESANAPIQRARALGVDPDGGYYIVDNVQAAVLRFSAQGAPARRYGARGDGPGEFRGPAAVSVFDDSLLAVTDVRRRSVTILRRDNGKFVAYYAIPGTPSTVHGRGGQLWVGSLNLATRMSASRVSMRDSTIEAILPMPRIYAAEGPLTLLHPDVHVVPTGRSIVVGFSAANSVAIGSSPSDTIVLPVTRRRGVPADLVERMSRAASVNPNDVYALSSTLVAFEALAGDKMIAVHLDVTLPPGVTFPTPPGAPNPFRYKLYASMINLVNRRVCADVPIPISGDEAPMVAVKGDTLYVLDQDSASSDPWVIRRFRINDSACTWQ